MTDAIAAYGTLLKVGNGATSETFTTIAEVRDISGPALAQVTKDVTAHDGSGWRDYIATLLEAGEVSFELNFVPDEATHDYSSGLIKDLVDKTKRNFQLVFPDTTTWAFTALVSGFEPSAAVEDELKAEVTLTITGAPTLA